MADVTISSETTGDSSDFLTDLAKDKQALADFANYANALKISPQFEIDTTSFLGKARTAFSQLQSDAVAEAQRLNQTFSSLNSINLRIDTTQASQQIQSLLSQVQNVTMTLNVPNVSQIGTDIGNAAGVAFINAVQGMTLPGGGGGGGSGSGGGSGGGGGHGGRGFGRYLAPAFLIHHGIQSAMQLHEANIQEMIATNPHELAQAAERQLRIKESFVPILGPAVGMLTDEAMGNPEAQAKLLDKQSDLSNKYAESSAQQTERATSAMNRASLEGLGGTAKGRASAQEDYREAQAKARVERQKQGEERAQLYQADKAGAELANPEKAWYAEGAGRLLLGAVTLGNSEAVLPFLPGSKDRDEVTYRRDLAVADAQAAQRNKVADAEQKKIEAANQIKLDEAQKKLDIEDTYADSTSATNVRSIRGGIETTNLRMSGQTRKAKDLETQTKHAKEEEEIENARDKANSSRDYKERDRQGALLGVTRDKNKAEDAEQKQEEDRQEALSAAKSQDRISNLGVSVQAANLRAGGNNEAAGNLEYQNSLDEKVKSLRDSAKAEKDTVTKNQMLAEATAQEAANTQLVAARKAEQAKALGEQISDIESSANVTNLRAQGRGFEADKSARDNKYKDLIRKANEEDPTGGKAAALRKKQAAEENLEEFTHGSQVENLQDSAAVKHLRNAGDERGAGLLDIENKYKHEIESAAGDKDKLAALQLNKTEDTLAFMRTTGGGTKDEEHWKSVGSIFAGMGIPPMRGGPIPPGGHPVHPADRGANPNDAERDQGGGESGGLHIDPWSGKGSYSNSSASSISASNSGAAGVSTAMANQNKMDDAVDKFATTVDLWKNTFQNSPAVILGDLA